MTQKCYKLDNFNKQNANTVEHLTNKCKQCPKNATNVETYIHKFRTVYPKMQKMLKTKPKM